MKMKELAKLAYKHQKVAGQPLNTEVELNSKKLYKLLKHMDKILNDAGVIENIVYANLYYDPENGNSSDISTTKLSYLTFRYKF